MDKKKAPEEERIMSYKERELILDKQVDLLTKWNEQNVELDPEQVRRNAETILNIIRYLHVPESLR